MYVLQREVSGIRGYSEEPSEIIGMYFGSRFGVRSVFASSRNDDDDDFAVRGSSVSRRDLFFSGARLCVIVIGEHDFGSNVEIAIFCFKFSGVSFFFFFVL